MRTYGSRFSGFVMFVLGIVLIGVLVFLTFRSSNQDEGFVDEGATVSDSSFVLDGEGTLPSDETSTTDDLTIVGSNTSSSDGQVAASVDSNSDALPNTGPGQTLLTIAILSLLSGVGSAYWYSRNGLVVSAKTISR